MKAFTVDELNKIIEAITKIININYFFIVKGINNPAIDTSLIEIEILMAVEINFNEVRIIPKEQLDKMKKDLGLL